MKKPKTQTQRDRATDQRLRKTYGITLNEYNELCAVYDGKCWICRKPPGTVRLSVDHDHSWTKIKIQSTKWTVEKNDADAWLVEANYVGESYFAIARKKSEALRELKAKLKRASVRGVCCVWCNRGLRFYHDQPTLLRNAADYIEDFEEGKTQEVLDQ